MTRWIRPVAQLAEHRSPKPGVGGSIPSWPARMGRARAGARGQSGMAEPTTLETVREAAGGRVERARVFLSEVRNELKRVTWPSQKEVYATTIVVILVSVFFGLYLFALDFGIDSLVIWIMRKFGVGA